jgi:hypothetical protein
MRTPKGFATCLKRLSPVDCCPMAVHNADISPLFNRMADLLETEGANSVPGSVPMQGGRGCPQPPLPGRA